MFDRAKRKISRWKWPVAIVLSIAGVTCVAFVAYRAYESHLSSDLRQILTTALGSGASIAEIRKYQSDARIAVHTRKDRDIDAKFDKLAALVGENCDTEESSMKSARRAATQSLAAVVIDQDAAAPVGESEVQKMDTTVDTADNAFHRYLACEARVNHDRQAMPRMIDDLGAALSLPLPKPEPVPATAAK